MRLKASKNRIRRGKIALENPVFSEEIRLPRTAVSLVHDEAEAYP